MVFHDCKNQMCITLLLKSNIHELIGLLNLAHTVSRGGFDLSNTFVETYKTKRRVRLIKRLCNTTTTSTTTKTTLTATACTTTT